MNQKGHVSAEPPMSREQWRQGLRTMDREAENMVIDLLMDYDKIIRFLESKGWNYTDGSALQILQHLPERSSVR